MIFGLLTKFSLLLSVKVAHCAQQTHPNELTRTLWPDAHYAALLREDHHALLSLSKQSASDMSDDFYKLAFCKLKHLQFEGDLGEAVLEVVKMVDFFNALDGHVAHASKASDSASIDDGVMAVDDLLEDMFGEVLKCNVSIQNDPNDDQEANGDNDNGYLEYTDAEHKMALLMSGHGKLTLEVYVCMVAAMAHLATMDGTVCPSSFLKHAIITCHRIFSRLFLKGSCRLALAVVQGARLHVVHVGPAQVKLACNGVVMFETTSTMESLERVSAEVGAVRVSSYESVAVNVRPDSTLSISIPMEGSFGFGKQVPPRINFTFT